MASHGSAEFFFACSVWVTSEQDWADHCLGHLDQPEAIPTQCNPFKYGGHLASPGYCPWCLGDVSLSATVRAQQFPDRLKWQSHIDDHIAKLEGEKPPICLHPRTQCTEVFFSMQDLKFHLQDVHCIEFSKGCKRPSLESEADPESRKVRISGDVQRRGSDLWTAAHVKPEYKFVDEAAKISVREASRRSTASSTSSKGSTPSLDWSLGSTGSGSETPPSLACSANLEIIDPRLFAETSRPLMRSSTDGTSESVDLTGMDKGTIPSQDQEGFPKAKRTTHSNVFKEMTTSIVSDHLGNSPEERDAHSKDCSLAVKVVHPRLDEASLNSWSSSYVQGMHLEGMFISYIEQLAG